VLSRFPPTVCEKEKKKRKKKKKKKNQEVEALDMLPPCEWALIVL
jgi:hypothetical protein